MSSDDTMDHRDEILALYQITVADLAYFKSNQWSVTNYVFLLLAGIVGVKELTGGGIAPWEGTVLFVLAALVAGAGLAMLFKLEQSIQVRQSRLDAARETLSAEFNAVWRAGAKGPEYFRAIWFLRSAIVVGAVIVLWICSRT